MIFLFQRSSSLFAICFFALSFRDAFLSMTSTIFICRQIHWFIILRSMALLATHNLFSYAFVNFIVSAPYVNTGKTHVSNNVSDCCSYCLLKLACVSVPNATHTRPILQFGCGDLTQTALYVTSRDLHFCSCWYHSSVNRREHVITCHINFTEKCKENDFTCMSIVLLPQNFLSLSNK